MYLCLIGYCIYLCNLLPIKYVGLLNQIAKTMFHLLYSKLSPKVFKDLNNSDLT